MNINSPKGPLISSTKLKIVSTSLFLSSMLLILISCVGSITNNINANTKIDATANIDTKIDSKVNTDVKTDVKTGDINTDTKKSPSPPASPSATVKPPQPTSIPTSAATPSPEVFDSNKDYRVVMETNMGTIKLRLFAREAPKTVENFTRLIAKKYYDGVTFHRIIPDFMIQGGDPLGNGKGGQSIFDKPFEDEFSQNLTFNKKGQLAMANSGPNTNGSQFFITLKATDWLNNKHTIFGEVTDGVAVLDAIANVKTGENNKPVTPVIMTKVMLNP